MKIQVVNQTVSDINLGGEIIAPSNSITLHQSFIQDERLEELEENFNIDTQTRGLMIIKDLKTTDENSDDETNVNIADGSNDDDKSTEANTDDETETKVEDTANTEDEDKSDEAEADDKIVETADENSDDETAKFYAYPKDVIKADGSLTGNVGKKKIIKALDDLELTFLDDNEFKAQYPELDIEDYRYKG